MATLADVKIRSDEAIRMAVIHEFKWDPRISSIDIACVVKDGLASLSGFVSSYMEKDAAEDAVKRVDGVRGVANDIKVQPGSRPSDPELARDVLENLENHILVPFDKIKVTVRDGWVTLEGTVDWGYQRKLVESAVKNRRGVVGVTNNIVIKPRISTIDVKLKIEEALKRNARIDAERITVEADGTTVTLSGTVQSWAEKAEADQAAWCAPGVTWVRNEIVVAP